MGASPGAASPEASMMQVSLVEVSESTVTLLKVWATQSARTAWRVFGATGASVVMSAIMVAMLGMIMPEPLTQPPTVNVQPTYSSTPLS